MKVRNLSRKQILQTDLERLSQLIVIAKTEYEQIRTKQAADKVNVLIGKAKTVLIKIASLDSKSRMKRPGSISRQIQLTEAELALIKRCTDIGQGSLEVKLKRELRKIVLSKRLNYLERRNIT